MKQQFGPIYAKASNDKTKIWQCEVNKTGETVTLEVTHGYQDGKQTTSSKEIKSVNIGKSNETTPWQQGLNEAQSKLNKKLDEGYVEDIEDINITVPLPMKAQNITKYAHKIVLPAYISPKLDGNRLTSEEVDNKILLKSKKGKEYPALEHLHLDTKELLKVLENGDGEAYLHGLPLQDITSACKKYNKDTPNLEYWIFDIPKKEVIYDDRYKTIKEFFNQSTEKNEFGFRKYGKLVEVPSYEVTCMEDIEKYHKQFTSLGFEGSMIRNKHGLYKFNHRSIDLLKKKDFLEDEFEIIGGVSADGDDIGTVVFRCKTKEGKEFDVRPKGSRSKRKEWLDNINSLIGQPLTVRFQYFSKDLIPCHARGIVIRTYE
ncbi:MAG: hypothetical protein M0R17_03310 [Candidatus Omnitrophica bacterium]|jgi:DNA ligase-1|nr:hypothetical protein [Candidatus Omnitrophota bacterium]